jgi:hypothetical protein
VRNQWLGKPDRAGTPFPDFEGYCGACFEDVHGLHWLPPFNPIEGHLWLLKHVVLGHDWQTAEADAPWRRYTSLRLNISKSYPRARLDWWLLDYQGPDIPIGIVLALLMAGGCAAGVRMYVRAVRPRAG